MKKKGSEITNYCLPVCFDLDAQTVTLGSLRDYAGMDSVRQFFNLPIGPPRLPSAYVCVDANKNLKQFAKTFFGKTDTAKEGEFMTELKKYAGLKDSKLFEVLRRILSLRIAFMASALKNGDVTLQNLLAGYEKLSPTQQVVLVYAEVKCSELGITTSQPFAQIVDSKIQEAVSELGYAKYIQARYKHLLELLLLESQAYAM